MIPESAGGSYVGSKNHAHARIRKHTPQRPHGDPLLRKEIKLKKKMPRRLQQLSATPAQIVRLARLCDGVEELLITAAIVGVLLFGGAEVESLLTAT